MRGVRLDPEGVPVAAPRPPDLLPQLERRTEQEVDPGPRPKASPILEAGDFVEAAAASQSAELEEHRAAARLLAPIAPRLHGTDQGGQVQGDAARLHFLALGFAAFFAAGFGFAAAAASAAFAFAAWATIAFASTPSRFARRGSSLAMCHEP